LFCLIPVDYSGLESILADLLIKSRRELFPIPSTSPFTTSV